MSPLASLPWTVPGEFEAWSKVLALAKGRPGRLAAVAIVLAAVVGASVLYSSVNKTVSLSIDGKASKVHAMAKTVADLLKDQDVKVGPRDIVAPAPASSLSDGETVVVRYARPLTLTVDGVKRTYWTTELSVDKALAALGIRADGAELSASRSQRINRAGLAMWLSTPKQVTLIVGGKTEHLTTVAPTVSALLAEQKLTVLPLDQLSMVPDAVLRDGLVVKLTRITQTRQTKTESVAFTVTRKKNASLYKGTTKVIKAGKAGSRTAVYLLTIADGRTTKRVLVNSTTISQPVAQIVEYGTKAKPISASGGGGTPSGGGLNWAALAKCESGGNPKAVNPAGYYGLYQFSLSTWHAQGGSGNPINASSAEQTQRAQILYGKTGASSWPSCGPKLFT
jgi:resuscitation-promoting factor RpfB